MTEMRVAIARHRINQAEIARKLGVTRGAVCHVTAGKNRSKRIEKELVRAGAPKGLFAPMKKRTARKKAGR